MSLVTDLLLRITSCSLPLKTQPEPEYTSVLMRQVFNHGSSWIGFGYLLTNLSAYKKYIYSKPLTCRFLEGSNGVLESSLCLSVGTGANLGVESCHVENHAGFLQRDVLLAHRHAGKGVIPAYAQKNVC